MKHKQRAHQRDTDETFFQIRAKNRGKTCANTKKSTQNTQISGSLHSVVTEYRCTLLYFSDINHFSTKQLNTLYVDYMHFTIKSTIEDAFQKKYRYTLGA